MSASDTFLGADGSKEKLGALVNLKRNGDREKGRGGIHGED